MSFDRRWDGWFAAMKTGNYSRCHNGGARCRCSRFRRNLCGQQLAMADQRPPYWQIRRLSVCLSLSGALTPVAASGLFGEKASMRKSEDKKLSFLLHPHVTSFLFARPPTATAAATGDLPLSPQLFPPILRLSCASGGEMEWISRPTSAKQSGGKNAEKRRSRWRRPFLSSRSFFARLSRLGWLVMSH